jgi:pimeloyl-ACP methyl ester carboxylesterase
VNGDGAQLPRPRPWCGLLSIVAPVVGNMGLCVVFAVTFNPIRGNPIETRIAPPILFWCGVSLVGLIAAGVALRRGERWRGLGLTGALVNGTLLPMLALWWIQNAPQGPVQHWERERQKEHEQFQHEKREHDQKNLRLRLTHENPPDWLRLTHVTWKDEFNEFQRIGSNGRLTGSVFPKGVTAEVAWTDARQFELTIDVATEETALKIDVVKLRDVVATNNGEPVALPLDFPAGKRRVVIQGHCP